MSANRLEYSPSGKEALLAMENALNYNHWIEQKLVAWRRGKSVLDFGAGSGEFAKRLSASGSIVDCFEPDEELQKTLNKKGFTTLPDLKDRQNHYDFIYSINVLEHIEDDAKAARELIRALKPGGRLFVYVPAWNCLYSPLDRQLGHFRRYTKSSLKHLFEPHPVLTCCYADSLGFAASLYLKGRPPGPLTPEMVKFYDQWVFPLSRKLDRLTQHFIGKNVYLVIEKK